MSNTSSSLITRLLATSALACCLPTAQAASSTFDSGIEGWAAIAQAGALVWEATEGNPGGHLSFVDTSSDITYFSASTLFLGNQSQAIGGNLTFDLQQRHDTSGFQFNAEDVILKGAGLTLTFNTASNPANGTWTSYVVPLLASQWRINSLTGAVATDAQFQSAMSNLTALMIRAEYQDGQDTNMLDNVALLPTIPAVPEPETYAMLLAGLGLMGVVARRKPSPQRHNVHRA